MDDLIIRDMRTEDYPVFDRFLGQLHKLHQEARPDLFRPAEHPLSQGFFEERLNDPGTRLLLAEVGGLPAGMCLFELEDGPRDPLLFPRKRAYLNDIFVAEGFRRMGVARALYREAERRAKDFGAEELGLTVWEFNESAQRFYREMGMTVRTLNLEKKL